MTWVNSYYHVVMEGAILGLWYWLALGFATGRSMGPDGMEPVPLSSEERKAAIEPDENPAPAQ